MSEIYPGRHVGTANLELRRVAVVSVAVAVALALSSTKTPESASQDSEQYLPKTETPKVIENQENEPDAEEPNIIQIMADDMDAKSLRFMPHTRRLILKKGVNFKNSFVTNSLCCPSRSTNLTGMYPHNHGIYTNAYPGGYMGFHDDGLEFKTYAKQLDKKYDTAFMGKMMNGYPLDETYSGSRLSPTYVPLGWNKWLVPVEGDPYAQYRYGINEDGVVRYYANRFLGQLIKTEALEFIEQKRDEPFMLNVWSYAPHYPAAYPPEDAKKFTELGMPQGPNFNEADVSDKVGNALKPGQLLSRQQIVELEHEYIERARSLQSLDRTVRAVVRTLRRTGQLDNTYIIFTSDNGYNMGQHRLPSGKNTPNEASIRVPLLMRGPGIARGLKVEETAGNIDIAPTILDMAGHRSVKRHDGVSLLPLAEGNYAGVWRTGLMSIAVGPGRYVAPGTIQEPGTPEEMVSGIGFPDRPNFYGIIGGKYARWRLFEYNSGKHEFYDMDQDPHQLNNLTSDKQAMTDEQRAAFKGLKRKLQHLNGCSGREDCNI